MILKMEDPRPAQTIIKVIGVGGTGCNAVNFMLEKSINHVEYISANTDIQSLAYSKAPTILQIGKEVTRGMGTGGDPSLGEAAALENIDSIRMNLKDAQIIFITAGMGGGTGTGASPVIARVAKEIGALTIALVTKPFAFEGKRRNDFAEAGIRELEQVADTILCIPNQKLMQTSDPAVTVEAAFRSVNCYLAGAVTGISDLVVTPGMINLDLADLKNVLSGTGRAIMGTGVSEGEKRAENSLRQAISCPLLDQATIDGARKVLINFTGGPDMTITETSAAATIIQESADREAHIIFGVVINPAFEGRIRTTVIASGFDRADNLRRPIVFQSPVQDEASEEYGFTETRISSGHASGGSVAAAVLDTEQDEDPKPRTSTREEPIFMPEQSLTPQEQAPEIPDIGNRPGYEPRELAPVASFDRNARPGGGLTGRYETPVQPELELHDEPEEDEEIAIHLPPYSRRNLANGAYHRHSELEAGSIQIDSSHYMIPAFLRRKAD